MGRPKVVERHIVSAAFTTLYQREAQRRLHGARGSTERIRHLKEAGAFTKTLAVAGSALVWFPILAPGLAALAALTGGRGFRFDYLMPAELFPSALLGGGVLFWAALRARSRRRFIGGSLAAAVCMLVGGQALAVLTGLASGEAEPVGLRWALVVVSLVVYTLSVAAMGVGGILLLRDACSRRPRTAEER